MNVEEALIILYTALKQKRLTSVQEFVFCQTWQGKTYAEMADNSSYDAEYLKFVGFQVWRLLSKALEVKVNKCNLHSVLREKARQISELAASVPRKLQKREAIAPSAKTGEKQLMSLFSMDVLKN